MRELTYTLLDLERTSRKTYDFCSNLYGEDNKSVNQIVVRIKMNGKYVADDVVCENCKEKFENDELLKCNRCGRLQTRHYLDVLNGKYICFCVKCEEDMEEKELPLLSHEEMSQSAFYEQQINSLREELTVTEEALEIEREEVIEFQEKSEEWSKRQKQELLDMIKSLEEKIKQLEEENRKLKDQQNGQNCSNRN